MVDLLPTVMERIANGIWTPDLWFPNQCATKLVYIAMFLLCFHYLGKLNASFIIPPLFFLDWASVPVNPIYFRTYYYYNRDFFYRMPTSFQQGFVTSLSCLYWEGGCRLLALSPIAMLFVLLISLYHFIFILW